MFPPIPLRIHSDSIVLIILSLSCTNGSGVDISGTDNALLNLPTSSKFDGNCQSSKYLNGYRSKILTWIKVKNKGRFFKQSGNECIIHIRGGDFSGITDVLLPREYYINAMEQIRKIDRDVNFYCVTDDPKFAARIIPKVKIIGSSEVNMDDPYKAKHHIGGPVSVDFRIMMNARYLVISNSSFSWWAAYLNNRVRKIIAPKYWASFNKSNGYWSTGDIITDRFDYLDRKGKLFSSEECWKEKNDFEVSHPEIFATYNNAKRIKPGSKNFLHSWLKNHISKI